MNIHLYVKLNEEISTLDGVADIVRNEGDELFITVESERSFRSLDKIIREFDNTIYIVSTVDSLGTNDAEIATRLSWFITNSVLLVIKEVPSTHEFGVSQPMNQAVLNTLLQMILSGNRKVIKASFGKNTTGRSKLPFPDNWDELYKQWENKQINSKQFYERAGVKKATFYNLLTEYKDLKAKNEKYFAKYKIV